MQKTRSCMESGYIGQEAQNKDNIRGNCHRAYLTSVLEYVTRKVQCGTLEIACRVQEDSSERVISELSPEGRIGFKELKTRIPGREHTILRDPEAMASPAQNSNGTRWPQMGHCAQDEGAGKQHRWRGTNNSDHEQPSLADVLKDLASPGNNLHLCPHLLSLYPYLRPQREGGRQPANSREANDRFSKPR